MPKIAITLVIDTDSCDPSGVAEEIRAQALEQLGCDPQRAALGLPPPGDTDAERVLERLGLAFREDAPPNELEAQEYLTDEAFALIERIDAGAARELASAALLSGPVNPYLQPGDGFVTAVGVDVGLVANFLGDGVFQWRIRAVGTELDAQIENLRTFAKLHNEMEFAHLCTAALPYNGHLGEQ